ncbi:MAG: hypothetical protein HYV02_06640 [Deltaproteobacteria bacterium]|nr:hypothetical protein [Deltaproteobacteria bacterium]
MRQPIVRFLFVLLVLLTGPVGLTSRAFAVNVYTTMLLQAEQLGATESEWVTALARSNILHADLRLQYGEENAKAIQQRIRDLSRQQVIDHEAIEGILGEVYGSKDTETLHTTTYLVLITEDVLKAGMTGIGLDTLQNSVHPMHPAELQKRLLAHQDSKLLKRIDEFMRNANNDGNAEGPGEGNGSPAGLGAGKPSSDFMDCWKSMQNAVEPPVPTPGGGPTGGQIGITPACEWGGCGGDVPTHGGRIPPKKEKVEGNCLALEDWGGWISDDESARKSFLYEKYGWKVTVKNTNSGHASTGKGESSVEFLPKGKTIINGELGLKGKVLTTKNGTPGSTTVKVTKGENQAAFEEAKKAAEKEAKKSGGELKAKVEKSPKEKTGGPSGGGGKFDPEGEGGNHPCGNAAVSFGLCIGGADPCTIPATGSDGDDKIPTPSASGGNSTPGITDGAKMSPGSKCGGGCVPKVDNLGPLTMPDSPDDKPDLCNAAKHMVPNKADFWTDPPRDFMALPDPTDVLQPTDTQGLSPTP